LQGSECLDPLLPAVFPLTLSENARRTVLSYLSREGLVLGNGHRQIHPARLSRCQFRKHRENEGDKPPS
jgi:hypothetical protein